MERSIMASVGTELPPPIDYPPAKRNRTPSRPRLKKVQSATTTASKPQLSRTPPKKSSLPLDPQQTVDVDEHLAKIPIKTKSIIGKMSDKSTKPSSKSQSNENMKEKKFEQPKPIFSSPKTTTPDEVERTQLSE